jgi:MFS family permease
MDETQPLLRAVTNEGTQVYTNPVSNAPPLSQHDGADIADVAETTIVEFDPRGDPENPLDWPAPFKWAVVSMLAFMSFTVCVLAPGPPLSQLDSPLTTHSSTMTCISIVPLASDIVRDLSGSPNPSKSASVLLVTIWELGEAAGPLLIAPLSEMFGRYPVMNAANILFIAAGVLAATSESVPQFVVARMLNGLAVAVNVLNPAIVGDMFANDERGGALSLLFLAPLIGGAFGPMIGSAVADLYGWRTVIWVTVVVASGCEVLFLFSFRETYKVAILRRRVEKMASHAAGSDKTFKTAFDEAEGLSTVGHSEWKKRPSCCSAAAC